MININVLSKLTREEKTEEPALATEAISKALVDTEQGRLLQYTCKAPAAPEGYQNRLKVVYSQVMKSKNLDVNEDF